MYFPFNIFILYERHTHIQVSSRYFRRFLRVDQQARDRGSQVRRIT